MTEVFRKQSPRKVIVSGATGFVGQHLVPLLLNNNYQVIATARDLKKAVTFDWYKDVQFIACDFHECETTINAGCGVGLIHLAWQGLPNYKSPSHLEENLPFNYRFVRSLILSGVSHALITGTCFEYGLQSGPIASDTKPAPNNPYAIAKDNLRQQLELLSKEYPFCLQWARLFYVHGKGQNPKSLIPQLEAAINNKDVTFNMSGGEQLRDYLPIAAVAQQLLDLYATNKAGTYNICSGNPISVRRLVEERISASGSTIKLNLGHYPYPEYEPLASWGVRDIGETILLPVLPNAPFKNKNQKQVQGRMRLRLNSKLELLENEAFDPLLIDYSEGYENSQAYSETFKAHMASVLELLKKHMPKQSVVVEVGCGKGDFIDMVLTDGYFKIKGFDAAYEGDNSAIEKRYLTRSDRINADLVILRHVLEHIPKPFDFLSMLKTVFGGAMIYIEVPNYDWIIENKAYFDVTYEHVNYFSQHALIKLFKQPPTEHGLSFGRQYQYLLSNLSSLSEEFDEHYHSKSWTYKSFSDLFPDVWQNIRRFDEATHGRSVFLWGAATKGCMFLAHCTYQKIFVDKVKFAIDQNPQKIGKYLPGSLVEIKSKLAFFKAARSGDLLIISNPAYKDEITAEVESAGLRNIFIETL